MKKLKVGKTNQTESLVAGRIFRRDQQNLCIAHLPMNGQKSLNQRLTAKAVPRSTARELCARPRLATQKSQ
jgi:hypothetical protein